MIWASRTLWTGVPILYKFWVKLFNFGRPYQLIILSNIIGECISLLLYKPSVQLFCCSLLMLSSPLSLDLSNVLFPSGFPPKSFMHLLFPYTWHIPYTLNFLTLSPKQYLVRNTNFETFHYENFSSPLMLSLRTKCVPQQPILENPQPTFLP